MPAFGTFSLLADLVVDVCGSKLDAVFKIFVTFSSGVGRCNTCFMMACWSIFACMGLFDVDVTAVTGVALFSTAALI